MASGGEGSFRTHANPRHDPRRGAHAATDKNGLARFGESVGQIGVPRAEGARRALAMNEETARLSIDLVNLLLARIVGHVEEQAEIGLGEKVAEHFACQMGQDLRAKSRPFGR